MSNDKTLSPEGEKELQKKLDNLFKDNRLPEYYPWKDSFKRMLKSADKIIKANQKQP